MKFKVQEIADLVGGRVVGNESSVITQCSKIEDAEQGSLTFLSNPKYELHLSNTNASAVLVKPGYYKHSKKTSLIEVDDPYLSFTQLLKKFESNHASEVGIHSTAIIATDVTLGKNVTVGPYAVIESGSQIGDYSIIGPHCWIGQEVQIGSDTKLHSRVSIYSKTSIGNHCEIKSGSVVGSDGFGYAPQKDKTYLKIPQTGNVVVHDNVHLGSNVTIDRATIGSTIIHEGVRIDNLVKIAHNVEVGKNTVIAAQSGVSGSSKLGENCVLGGQVGLIGHIKLGNGVRVQGQSGITKSYSDNTDIQGTPAIKFHDYYRAYAIFRRLPDLERRLNDIENQLKNASKDSTTADTFQ